MNLTLHWTCGTASTEIRYANIIHRSSTTVKCVIMKISISKVSGIEVYILCFTAILHIVFILEVVLFSGPCVAFLVQGGVH